MFKTKYLLLWICMCSRISCMAGSNSSITDVNSMEHWLDRINVFVGTAKSNVPTESVFGKGDWSHGQTIPAVLKPNGMTFWTPQTRCTQRRTVAPYYYEDREFIGFRNSHWIMGGNTHEYGSFALLPLMDDMSRRSVPFNHSDEVGHPYYYSLSLPSQHLKAEMTGDSHSAIFRLTYTKSGEAFILLGPNNDDGEGMMILDTVNHRILGYNPVRRIYQGSGERAGIGDYYVLEYPADLQMDSVGTYTGSDISKNSTTVADHRGIGTFLAFSVTEGQQITLKVSNSFTGFAGAIANLKAEIPDWDFARTENRLRQTWIRQLSCIEIEDNDESKIARFYGALYRASFLPHQMNDTDGSYPSFDGGLRINKTPNGEVYYGDYSLWDTFRAMHPLINILWPQKSSSMISSLLRKGHEGGFLPIFPAWNCYTSEMIGDHTLSVIADAWVKGVRGFDIEDAYRLMRHNAYDEPSSYEEYRLGKGRSALRSYLEYGFIPLEDQVKEAFHSREQTSRTMEYAYDDFCLAQVAKDLGKEADYDSLIHRATFYRNVIDPRTGYAQGRHSDGTFLDADNHNSLESFISEGAPCHYTWFAPHDPYGLMEAVGGRKAYISKLDSLFNTNRYWHGNEPCHHVAYMYNYAGQPWKTQKWVAHILAHEYSDTPGGLSGNDDAGQMSSWLIFSSLGFYPVCPGTPYYLLSAPVFRKVKLNLPGNHHLVIEAENTGNDNIYVQSVTRNRKPYPKNFISHSDILSNATFHFILGDKPNYKWGSRKADCPPDVMK